MIHGDPAADQIVRGPSGGCRGDLISTPDSGYYRVFYKSFLWGNLHFGGCFEKPSLQALFWCKKLRCRKKIGKVMKRRRSAKPTCANGGTNRPNGGTNASFCTLGDFQFFLAPGPVCFEFDSATVKREKKRRIEGKERLWPKAKRKDFLNFRSLVCLWRRKSTIVYTWYEEFLMQSTSVFMCYQVCLCVIERTIGV